MEGNDEMTYFLVLAGFCSAMVKKKSQIVTILLAVLVWIMFGWSSGNADYEIHLSRFVNYSRASAFTELLYTQLMRLFNSLGLDYAHFLIVISALFAIGLFYLAKKWSYAPAFVLGMYFIFPACIDVVQVRYSLAGIVNLFALYFLLNTDEKKIRGRFFKNEIIFCALVIVASLLHVSSIVFLLFVVVRRFDIKKTILYTAIVSFILAAGKIGVIQSIIGKLPGMSEKMARVLMGAEAYVALDERKAIIRILFFASAFIILLLMTRRRIRKKEEIDIKLDEWIANVMKINIVALTLIPLVTYTVDFYRIQQSLCILNYCALSWYFYPLKSGRALTASKKNVIFSILVIIVCIINLYLLVLRSTNINTVFFPYFDNNTLLH